MKALSGRRCARRGPLGQLFGGACAVEVGGTLAAVNGEVGVGFAGRAGSSVAAVSCG
jgi:hypothetical protein